MQSPKILVVKGNLRSPPVQYYTTSDEKLGLISFQTLLISAKQPIPKPYMVGLRCNFIRSLTSITPGSVVDDYTIVHIFNLSRESLQTVTAVSCPYLTANNAQQNFVIDFVDLDSMKQLHMDIDVSALFLYTE